MSLLTALVFLQLLVTSNHLADSKPQYHISSPGDGKLPSKCLRYNGQVCSKFVANMFVFVEPFQTTKETQMKALFQFLPDYISTQCLPYALHTLCLSAFPPCDLSVSHPKPRMVCKDECLMLEQYICAYEFNNAHAKYMASFVPPCSKLPSVGSAEHKKCVRLNITIDQLAFKLELKNKSVEVGDVVVLKCKVKAVEIPPTITWYKDGKVIQPGHAVYKIHLFRDSSRLKIRKIRVEDSGKYSCHVSDYVTNISTHSWLTVIPSKGNGLSRAKVNSKTRCGTLGASVVCGVHLQNKKVFFRNAKRQHEREIPIQDTITQSNLSSECQKLATAALCYHMFPACGKRNSMRHRLCKEDCLTVKRDICKSQLPNSFPACSDLPKRSGRRGRHCEDLQPKVPGKIIGSIYPKCGQYNGNGFCGKYVKNEHIYFYDKNNQYELEQSISLSLKTNPISVKCSKYGIPAICYHLFPVCSQNKRKSRLCREECTRIKTDVCLSEVSLIEAVSPIQLKALFPHCPSLPRLNTQEGEHCVKLGIPEKVLVGTNTMKNRTFYDPSHNCYNETGVDYLGTVNFTGFGNACISWNIHRPDTGWKHNFCRNPDGRANSTWCYVSDGRKEYCAVTKCELLTRALHNSRGDSTSLGRTIYVVIAIVAVIFLGCVTVIVYWKVQNAKESVDNSPQKSGTTLAKCSSTQLTDLRENTSIQSFVLNEKLTRGRVKYSSVMSEGKYFRVFKGVLINDQNKPNMDIVIKTLCEDASVMQKEIFRRETSLLCPLQHVNILGLLGISPTKGTEFVVFEYLCRMNLREYLTQHAEKDPPTDTLLDIACQTANGMKYLSEFSYVHGDLAARNCMIADEGSQVTVKISMLGIGSHEYPQDYDCLHQENISFPVRWMSPEALESRLFTSEDDIWSFGVLLWEIFSHGRTPYQHSSNAEVRDKVRARELLRCPTSAPQNVSILMNSCWSIAPPSRPNFSKIHDILVNLLTDDVIEEVKV